MLLPRSDILRSHDLANIWPGAVPAGDEIVVRFCYISLAILITDNQYKTEKVTDFKNTKS